MSSTGAGVNLYPSWAKVAEAAPNLPNGVIYSWNMDEASGNRVDSVGGQDLVVSGTVSGVAGKNNNAVNSVTGGINYLSKLSIPMTLTSFTVAVWVKKSAGGGTTLSWNFPLIISATLGIRVNTVALGSAPPVDGNWHLVIGWADGTACGASTDDGTPVTDTHDKTSGAYTLYIPDPDDASASLVDELVVWNRPLTAAERTALYNAGAGTFYPFS